jgi:hypothetical protein
MAVGIWLAAAVAALEGHQVLRGRAAVAARRADSVARLAVLSRRNAEKDAVR